MKTTAIVLSAGSGKRMGGDMPKQYMQLEGRPIIYYSLKAFEDSVVDDIILVTAEDYMDYCRDEIVAGYGLNKVRSVVKGGAERYDSVYNGLTMAGDADYVFIHDGARPFVSREIISRGLDCVIKTDACIAAMPVKDTIKSVDDDKYVTDTPDRKYLWQVQTPQIFNRSLLLKAYDGMHKDTSLKNITDDAMLVENYTDKRVSVFEGSYNNIKITTVEDMVIAGAILKSIINE